MAPLEADDILGDIVKRQGLSKYVEEDIPKLLAEYDKYWEKEDPEENPYKSKYEARKLLEDAIKEVERRVAEISECDEKEQGREMIARLFVYLGKNLYFCEEVPNAEQYFNRSLERYLRSPRRLDPCCFVHIQDLLNQLGMLWCNRYNHAEGMNFLRRAQIMYLNRPQAVRESRETEAENNYTLTMFYLAQAYGGLKKPGLSARFCAETMSRQLQHNLGGERPKEVLERDPFDCKDWVRNCCSLSDFFANECMFWTAEYLLHAANVMCERCEEICGLKPENIDELTAEVRRDLGLLYSTRLKFAKTCTENPALCEEIWRGERKPAHAERNEESPGTRLSFRCAADQGALTNGDDEPVKWDDIFPEVVHLEDEEAEDNKLAEETMAAGEFSPPSRACTAASGAAAAAASWLELGPEDRIRLPVHFGPLHAIVERRLRRASAGFLQVRGRPALVDDLEEVPEDEASGDAKPSAEAKNKDKRLPSCVGTSFEAAREIFKLGNHYMMISLCHFQLDGWVTEHVRILQELSQMYRSLCFWEKDPKRASAMLARRRQMLAPLLDQLNPRAYVAFYRQLSFEVAELIQEHYELKADGKMPGKGLVTSFVDDDDEGSGLSRGKIIKCNKLALEAIKYFEVFVGTYHTDGKVPDKVEDADTRPYLTAKMNMARLSTKLKGLGCDEQLEWHKKALDAYQFILSYGQRNPDTATKEDIAMATELRLCEEMAGMLPAKLSRIAAQRR